MALTIETTLAPQGPATAILLTDPQVVELGGGPRAAVLVTVAGRTERLRLARMGGLNCIGLSKAVRAAFNVEIGDTITAEIALDTAERTVDVPTDLAAALDSTPGLRAKYDALSYSRRKELARAVHSAKRPETRERRIAAAVAEVSGA
ncbi:uncharacterized protein DUF1905 [Leucobacter luti]|uniref:Uncharacterized protein DUF1905 n=1 Tax=Leucobacter luti TaxID=340320 RepID=A0A4R6RR57_9MICO|nr:YdeI/OmpD-associated family protein [Leucobacter luti]TDP89299.1 uncharacterized protein DUF1905 [Leucobacter luti]